jgi:hypothetical protein
MRFIIGIIFATLIGCATPYKAPQNANLAQLRVYAPDFAGWSGIRLVNYDNGKCETPSIVGVISGLHTSKSDPNTTIPKNNKHVKGGYIDKFIEADTELNMTIAGFFMNSSCRVPMAYTLGPNENYELHYYWSGDKCYVEINNISNILNDKKYPINMAKPEKACSTGFSGPAF